MDPQLLIHNIVRQTTVLIAQVSTAAGLRAPLAHVANQVFLDLARELESQGVRRNVVADMFGLALRSYQLKYQRALEVAVVQRSLWREVFDVLGAGAMTRASLGERFPRVEAKTLSAVVNDLVGSGLAFASGRGRSAIYGIVPQNERERLAREAGDRNLSQFVWLHLSTLGEATRTELIDALGITEAQVDEALAELGSSGKVREAEGRFAAIHFDIQVGDALGWEAAVCDHFRAVANAIAAKLESPTSRADDRIGGTTLKFTVYEGHPEAAEVFGLLQRFRAELNQLWDRTSAYNNAHVPPDHASQVTFYFGQNVAEESPHIPRDPRTSPNEEP